MKLIDEKFRQMPIRFIAQSGLAFVAVAIIAIYLGTVTHGAVVAALGASAFIVFATPHHDTAQPRRLIGGHVVCIAVGLLCSIPFRLGILGATNTSVGIIAATAVGIAILVMTMTDTEHPPAAGNALAFAISVRGMNHAVFILCAVVSLAVIHHLCRKWLCDLT
jgi:CBS-domain-containing membrane protein